MSIWPIDDTEVPSRPPVGRSNVAPPSERIEIPLSVAGDHVKILIGSYRGKTGSILYLLGDKDDSARVLLDEDQGTATIPRTALFPDPVPGAVSMAVEDRKVA